MLPQGGCCLIWVHLPKGRCVFGQSATQCLNGIVFFLSVGSSSFRRKCLRRRQALSEWCESSKPAYERSSQTSGESTDGRQSLKPTGNEQQNRACVLCDGGWVEAVCLVAGSDVVFQCRHGDFDQVQGATNLVSHTSGRLPYAKCLSISLSYSMFLLSSSEKIGVFFCQLFKTNREKQV